MKEYKERPNHFGPLIPPAPGKSGQYLIVRTGSDGLSSSFQVRFDASLWTKSRQRLEPGTTADYYRWDGRAWQPHVPVKPEKK